VFQKSWSGFGLVDFRDFPFLRKSLSTKAFHLVESTRDMISLRYVALIGFIIIIPIF